MPGSTCVNPFKPTAGAEPPVLAGRKKVIDDFTDGLTEGPGVPAQSLSSARASLIAKQIVEPTEVRGYVDFAIPGMRGYVSDHVDSLMARFCSE